MPFTLKTILLSVEGLPWSKTSDPVVGNGHIHKSIERGFCAFDAPLLPKEKGGVNSPLLEGAIPACQLISIIRPSSFFFFGILIISTPFLKVADTLSESTSAGRPML